MDVFIRNHSGMVVGITKMVQVQLNHVTHTKRGNMNLINAIQLSVLRKLITILVNFQIVLALVIVSIELISVKKNMNFIINNMQTIQDTYEETGSGFGINIGGSSNSTSGSSANNSPKTGGVQNIGINASYKDIFKATTGDKTGISATSSTVNVAGNTTDLTDKKDREFVNGDFEGGISVPTMVFTKEGRAEIGKAYKNFGGNSVTAGKGVWAATATPYTAAGALYGFAGWAYSKTLGDGKAEIKHNKETDSLEFSHNPLHYNQDGGAITLGHTINYLGTEGSADSKNTTYEFNSSDRPIATNADRIILGDHERQHIEQYDQLGILLMPTYFAKGGISHKNPYEQAADKAGNEAFIQWKYEKAP